MSRRAAPVVAGYAKLAHQHARGRTARSAMTMRIPSPPETGEASPGRRSAPPQLDRLSAV
jgi:hypothetical protein